MEKKCKGVKQYVVENCITIDDYRECLFSKQPQLRTMNTIRSRQHNIGSERINKTALSTDDDKESFQTERTERSEAKEQNDDDVITNFLSSETLTNFLNKNEICESVRNKSVRNQNAPESPFLHYY